MIDPDQLVNLTTIAARTGIPRTRLSNWSCTDEDFPAVQGDPAATGGRLYLWPEVDQYLQTR